MDGPGEARSPLLDDGNWSQLIEAIGPESMLLVIEHWMGERLGSQFQPEDVWQETLLHAWRDRGKHQWRGVKSFRGWMLAIARNRIRDLADHVSSGKAGGGKLPIALCELAQPGSQPDSASDYVPGISTTPDRLASMRERARMMRTALDSLPADLGVIVRRYLFEEEPMDSIAKDLGLPVSTAWSRFRKGSELYSRKLEFLTSRGDGGQSQQ